ncbi:MAG: hypothetical protein A3A44_00730 [Candidatus Sungbacteria bacterium RIFCSPLOWO2_01_FULL_60_25]|uniref:Short-chain dehydrogenase n=1 Tax=Candidatus Sungbacteria bacterium RIFCSPLOWO2_01_FULL_60_25 TaxID=1802281 RepID=A0A1G2LD10_9BACT|nr:MAG: hypothetical protein A3A44_00730 [Candidatus Sungbacteria bacterium RIFCSPLOWO2_01_FULL_60_25]
MATVQEKLFSVRGNVILITGGAGMLGMEYATFLSRAGARVVIFDIADESVLRAKADEVRRRTGRRPFALPVDITDEEAVRDAVRRAIRRFGRIDALVNNAALNPKVEGGNPQAQFSPYERYPVDLWRKELDVGLTGAFIVTKAVMPAMGRRRAGVIVNIGSLYGETAPDNRIYPRGQFKSIAYATAKGAMGNFTRALASYLAPFQIRVNQLTPGGVRAGQPPAFVKKYESRTMLGRMARRDDFNGALLFLLSDASRYMTGANLVVDGGWSAW